MSKGKPHPTKSFEQYVAEAVNRVTSGYIDQQIEQLGQQMFQHLLTKTAIQGLRQRALESIMCDKLGVKPAEITRMIAGWEDEVDGFLPVAAGEKVQLGDRTRLEIRSKLSEAAEFGKTSNLMLNATGTGETLGQELEESLLGLLEGETREVVFGPDGKLTAQVTVNMISRKPAPPPAPAAEPTPEPQPENQEGTDGTQNEG